MRASAPHAAHREARLELIEVANDGGLEALRSLERIPMRAAQRLLDHFVDHESLLSFSAVRFRASAAASFLSWLFQRMEAAPFGEITE